MAEPRYPYVVVDVGADEVDEASAILFDLGAQGVEERDASTLVKETGGGAKLIASFATHDEAREAIARLPSAWAPRLEEVVGDAWRDEWKKHFEPFVLCPGIVVRPPWKAYEPPPGAAPPPVILELEPGRAFGTGLHETTSLVAEAIERHRREIEGRTALDVGCGSGILSLVAIALGASCVRAIDVDPEAAAATRENAARNRMESRIVADTTDVSAIPSRYALVVANIEASVLVPMAEALLARVEPGGLLMLSGILADDVVPGQVDAIRSAYAKATLVDEQRKGEWVALVYRSPMP